MVLVDHLGLGSEDLSDLGGHLGLEDLLGLDLVDRLGLGSEDHFSVDF